MQKRKTTKNRIIGEILPYQIVYLFYLQVLFIFFIFMFLLLKYLSVHLIIYSFIRFDRSIL